MAKCRSCNRVTKASDMIYVNVTANMQWPCWIYAFLFQLQAAYSSYPLLDKKSKESCLSLHCMRLTYSLNPEFVWLHLTVFNALTAHMTFRPRDLDLDLDLWGFDPVLVQVAGTCTVVRGSIIATNTLQYDKLWRICALRPGDLDLCPFDLKMALSLLWATHVPNLNFESHFDL